VVTSLAFSPDGTLLAVTGYHEILLHKADGSGLVARLVGMSERVQAVAFSPDGKLLAAAAGDPGRVGEVQVWDVAKRELKTSAPVTFAYPGAPGATPQAARAAFPPPGWQAHPNAPGYFWNPAKVALGAKTEAELRARAASGQA
jgi:hypothetical protein